MPSLRPQVARPPITPVEATELVARKLASPVFVDVVVPRTAVAGSMRLATRAERMDANAGARRFLADAGFPVDVSAVTSLGANEQWHYEVGLRILAAAIRDPKDTEQPLATVDEWRDCDDDQLDAMWALYEDHRAAQDPASLDSLTDADVEQIEVAAKKKDAAELMSFGLRKLTSFVLTLEGRPATSTTPPS